MTLIPEKREGPAPKGQAQEPTPVRRGRVTALVNLKGGVGKTTTGVNMACGLARGILRPGTNRPLSAPARVCLIDLEPLCTASNWLNVTADTPFESSAALFDELDEDDFGDADQVAAHRAKILSLAKESEFEPIHVIASHPQGVDVVDMAQGKSLFSFKDNLEILRERYDHVIIDLPGQRNNRMFKSTLLASDGIIIPIIPDATVMYSMRPVITAIRDTQKMGSSIRVDGWLITNTLNRQDKDGWETTQVLRETPNVHVFNTWICRRKAIQRSSLYNMSVFGMKDDEAVRDFNGFLTEWLEGVKKNG